MKTAKKDKAETGTKKVSCKELFGFNIDFDVWGFEERTEFVPETDENYCFNQDVTTAILAGFMFNRRVLVQGFHGTGKSTHIEQVAARLNWPLVRINLDGHISRIDLIGKDIITLRDGKQVTEFKEGILPFAMQKNMAIVFDEYDAGRPDVMFIIQRVLETEGKFTMVDQNRVITPHKNFRLFATSNTLGFGDTTGIYHGTQAINQGQMDRWNIVTTLNYLKQQEEIEILLAKNTDMNNSKGKELLTKMLKLADLTRSGFINGDISIVMSPRTLLSWAENYRIFGDVEKSFRLTFLNKCDDMEKGAIAEYYQRCFGVDLPEAAAKQQQN